jgi:putative addiction module CopG family antidote
MRPRKPFAETHRRAYLSRMGAIKITLTEPLDAFVEEQVRLGAYPDAESVVRAGLDLLRGDDAARTVRYHALIQEGLDDLDAGRFEIVDDVDGWLKGLGERPPE